MVSHAAHPREPYGRIPTAVIRGAELVLGDVVASQNKLVRNLLGSLDVGVQGIGDADEDDLSPLVNDGMLRQGPYDDASVDLPA